MPAFPSSILLDGAAISDTDGRYTVGLARTAADVQAAQRLRYQVFAEELGARVESPVSGVEADRFDAYGDHVLVRLSATGEVVATCRLLAPGRADRLSSETQFDLGGLRSIRKDLVEVDRCCVRAGHRDGTVAGLLWAGIAQYTLTGGHTWLAGRSRVSLGDGGGRAAAVADRVGERHASPPEYQVTPRHPWPVAEVRRAGRFTMPAMLRGPLRLGAWVCGPPAHDPRSDTAAFFLLLRLADVDTRYVRRFLGVRD